MSRWFTWEQVNFNSAVHHALSEALQTLSAYQQELAGLRGELSKEGEIWREKFEHSDRELTAVRTGIDALRRGDTVSVWCRLRAPAPGPGITGRWVGLVANGDGIIEPQFAFLDKNHRGDGD